MKHADILATWVYLGQQELVDLKKVKVSREKFAPSWGEQRCDFARFESKTTQVASLNDHLLKEKVSRIGQNGLCKAVLKKFLIHQRVFISIILTKSPSSAGFGRIFPNAKGVKVIVTR